MWTDGRATERPGGRGAKPLALALLLAAAGASLAMAQEGPHRVNDTPMSDHAISQTPPSVSPPPSPPSESSARSGVGEVGGRYDDGGDARSSQSGGGDVEHADNRGGHRGGGHRGGGHRGGGHRGYGGGHHGYYPYGWWGSFWFGYPYPNYYPYPYDYPYGYNRHRSDRYGAIDLDVNPGRTQVYLDGQYIGTTDGFDGWPEYLWLEKGTYDLAFYLEGHRTISRQVSVYPGIVIDVDFRMEPGDAVRPEDLGPKSHERRDARLRQDEEMRQRAERGERPGDDWRDRVRDRRQGDDADDDGDDDDRPLVDQRSRDADGALDARGEPGRLRLSVAPDDASVYLDGRFLGTGEELAGLHSGLRVDPGEHVIAVVRPGRKSEEKRFTVKAGEEVEVEVELDSD